MENKTYIRIKNGLNEICRDKRKFWVPIIFLIILYGTWIGTKDMIPESTVIPFPLLYRWIYVVFLFEIALIGIIFICIKIGTPIQSRVIERRLSNIDFTDHLGYPPMLLAKKKKQNINVFEFFSPRMSLMEFEKRQDDIETALNIKIIEICQGKNMQHVLIKAIAPEHIMPSLIIWEDSYVSDQEFILKLGKSYYGDEEFNLALTPHILIGGGTGSGKSTLLKLLLVQSIKKGAKVYLADFKGGLDYPGEWREKCVLITDLDALLNMLVMVKMELEERRQVLYQSGSCDVAEYNTKCGGDISRIIIAIDEVAEVFDRTGLEKADKVIIEKIERLVTFIARQGRAFGIHLILATQRPDAEIIKGQIKGNLGMRLCGRADKVLSQIILDNSEAAEKVAKIDQGVFLTNTGKLFRAYYVEDNCL